jgi:hypothetical protein
MPQNKVHAFLPNGSIVHLTIAGEGTYKVTHHTLPKRQLSGETVVENLLLDADNNIRIIANDSALLVIGRDTRHTICGWRATRYINGTWDEWYLFFESLDSVIRFCCNPTDEIRRIAQLRF